MAKQEGYQQNNIVYDRFFTKGAPNQSVGASNPWVSTPDPKLNRGDGYRYRRISRGSKLADRGPPK